MANKKPRRPLPSRAEYLAAAERRYDKLTRPPKPVGRPLLAVEALSMIHNAVIQLEGPLTQGRIVRATRARYDIRHKTVPECVVPSGNTLRTYVKAYLLYRRGVRPMEPLNKTGRRLKGLKAYGMNGLGDYRDLTSDPKRVQNIRQAVVALPLGIHLDTILGYLGALPSKELSIEAPTNRQWARRAANVTRRIRAIASLPKPAR